MLQLVRASVMLFILKTSYHSIKCKGIIESNVTRKESSRIMSESLRRN